MGDIEPDEAAARRLAAVARAVSEAAGPGCETRLLEQLGAGAFTIDDLVGLFIALSSGGIRLHLDSEVPEFLGPGLGASVKASLDQPLLVVAGVINAALRETPVGSDPELDARWRTAKRETLLAADPALAVELAPILSPEQFDDEAIAERLLALAAGGSVKDLVRVAENIAGGADPAAAPGFVRRLVTAVDMAPLEAARAAAWILYRACWTSGRHPSAGDLRRIGARCLAAEDDILGVATVELAVASVRAGDSAVVEEWLRDGEPSAASLAVGVLEELGEDCPEPVRQRLRPLLLGHAEAGDAAVPEAMLPARITGTLERWDDGGRG